MPATKITIDCPKCHATLTITFTSESESVGPPLTSEWNCPRCRQTSYLPVLVRVWSIALAQDS